MKKTGVFLLALSMLIIGILISYLLSIYFKQANVFREEASEFTWKLIWEKKFDGPVYEVVISPSGRYISAKIYYVNRNLTLLSINGSLLWNRAVTTYPYNEMFLASVNDEGSILLSVSNGSVMLLDVNGKLIKNLSAPTSTLNLVQSLPSRDEIIVAAWDRIRLLDSSGNEQWHWTCLYSIDSFSISPDGRYVAVVDDGSWIYLLDRSGELVFDKNVREELQEYLEGIWEAEGFSVYFVPSKDALLVAGGGFFGLLDLNGDWILKPRRISYSPKSYFHWPYVFGDLAVSKDFIFTFSGKHVYIYDCLGKLLQTITVREEVNDVASTPNGRYLVVASEDMRVYLYEKVR